MLNECLTVTVCRPEISPKSLLNTIRNPQKGLNEIKNAGDSDARPKTPSPLIDIKIYGEVSFTHKVTSQATVVRGCVDYGIGRILKTCLKNAVEQRKRRFYSLLLLVEAKFDQCPPSSASTRCLPGISSSVSIAAKPARRICLWPCI